MQEINPNIHSQQIRDLADAVATCELNASQVQTVKAHLQTLASLHELLSDSQFDSDTFQAASDLFATHGLELFNMDGPLDEDGLKAKYAGDDAEPKAPGEHPYWPRKEWVGAVTKSETDRGYWDWVRVQIEDNE